MKKGGIIVGMVSLVLLMIILILVYKADQKDQLNRPPEKTPVNNPGEITDPEPEEWQKQQAELQQELWRKDAIVIYREDFSEKQGDTDIGERILKILNENKDDSKIFDRIVLAHKINEKGEAIEERVAKAINNHIVADFDSDGIDEIAITYINLHDVFGFIHGVSEGAGGVMILEKNIEGYKPSFTRSFDLSRAGIEGPFDITHDKKLELNIYTSVCGAHTCHPTLTIVEWDGSNWRYLTPDDFNETGIGGAYVEFSFEDKNSDGVQEIIMTGGQVGSAGAGEQRDWVTVYSYDARTKKYAKTDSYPTPSNKPYFLMIDAYRALQKGEYDTAITLSKKVLDKPFTEQCIAEESMCNPQIGGYAGVLAMLGYLSQKPADVARAEAILPLLGKYQLTTDDGLENPYISGAYVLLERYTSSKDAKIACQAMKQYIVEHAQNAEFYDWYGYNQERISLDTICPLSTQNAPVVPLLE